MANWKSLGGGAVLSALLTTTASADVTAQQVWQSWKDLSTSMGQTMTAESEEMSGDTLTVSNLTFASENAGATAAGTLEEIAFKELGDGTVEITMSPDYKINTTTTVEGEDPIEVAMTIRQTDLRMIAAGSDTEIDYDFTAPEIAIVLDSVSGGSGENPPVDMTLAVKNIVGNYKMTKGAMSQIDSEFDADTLTFDIVGADPAGTGEFKMNGSMDALKAVSTITVVPGTDMADMAAALKAGFATDGSFTYGKTDFTADFKDETSSGNATGTSASGGLTFAMDAEQLAYGVLANATDVTVSSSDMPVPEMNLKLAETGFSLVMPTTQSDEPKDFALLTKVVGLSLSDEIWGLFDPAAVLPRDPATVILDLTGKGNWLIDIMSPEAQAAAETSGETPGELHALTLKQLQVTAAGADLSGTGDFTFDNTDTTTFPGMPKPTGTMDLRLVGANGLMDKLVQMGLLPEDQLMGFRMMLGMFARPGEGEDTLTSQIEVREDGSVFANGQQLQ